MGLRITLRLALLHHARVVPLLLHAAVFSILSSTDRVMLDTLVAREHLVRRLNKLLVLSALGHRIFLPIGLNLIIVRRVGEALLLVEAYTLLRRVRLRKHLSTLLLAAWRPLVLDQLVRCPHALCDPLRAHVHIREFHAVLVASFDLNRRPIIVDAHFRGVLCASRRVLARRILCPRLHFDHVRRHLLHLHTAWLRVDRHGRASRDFRSFHPRLLAIL